jgi:hypothetical protein
MLGAAGWHATGSDRYQTVITGLFDGSDHKFVSSRVSSLGVAMTFSFRRIGDIRA